MLRYFEVIIRWLLFWFLIHRSAHIWNFHRMHKFIPFAVWFAKREIFPGCFHLRVVKVTARIFRLHALTPTWICLRASFKNNRILNSHMGGSPSHMMQTLVTYMTVHAEFSVFKFIYITNVSSCQPYRPLLMFHVPSWFHSINCVYVTSLFSKIDNTEKI